MLAIMAVNLYLNVHVVFLFMRLSVISYCSTDYEELALDAEIGAAVFLIILCSQCKVQRGYPQGHWSTDEEELKCCDE